jgi:hypothetical protein
MEKSMIFPVENQSLQTLCFLCIQKPKVFERFLQLRSFQKFSIFGALKHAVFGASQSKIVIALENLFSGQKNEVFCSKYEICMLYSANIKNRSLQKSEIFERFSNIN